ncbi:sensor histidine kinase [Pollutibacter soli]|uniref:sensor histidine kinase n=1 Tax=Pollutibacter soli TaxID=3034157 RepID=UPI00301389BF
MCKLQVGIIFCIAICNNGLSQSSTPPAISNYVYHHPSEDKETWQRLNLWLSSTYLLVVNEGQADQDFCLLKASHSLGLSRLPILAEGIDDAELTRQARWIDQQNPAEGIRLLSLTKGKQHVELLILLGAYYAFQPNNYRLYKDSVEYFLSHAIKEAKSSNEVELGRQARCLLTKMYFQANEVDKGDSIFIPLIKECQIDGDKESEARAFAYRGIYEPFLPAMFQGKLADMQRAAELYHETNDLEGEINALTDVGYLLVIMNQLQPAYDVLIKAIKLQDSIKYPYVQYNTDILAFTTINMRRFGEPLKYAIQTVQIAEATRDSIGWGSFYARLGYMYSFTNRNTETSKWKSKAINRFLFDRNPLVYTLLPPNWSPWEAKDHYLTALKLIENVSKKIPAIKLTDLVLYHEAISGCYIGLREYHLAEQHLGKADSIESILQTLRGPLNRSRLDLRFASLHIIKGEFSAARILFEKYFLNPNIKNGFGEDNLAYQSLIFLDSVQGDLKAGMAHYKKYMKHQDSAFQAFTVRQADELKVLYEIEEKEKEIALLNQQALFEQANLKQATLVKNLTIGGIVSVLIITSLLYRQNRLRKKNNTDITHKNELLQHLLTEKEWLLKEIHHRVKNNLQIVMSLLNSQSAYINNAPALSAIHDSQHRVHAMSLIHQKLYNSENLSFIDMSLYIRELVSYLSDSFNMGQRILFELRVDTLQLDVSQAVPLGLILNEAITNSIKYAFPNDREGVIKISLSNTYGNQYLLEISDNGIGIPSHLENKKDGSLGISLMAGLSEDLDGSFSIENSNGTAIRIIFVHDMGVKRTSPLITSFVNSN